MLHVKINENYKIYVYLRSVILKKLGFYFYQAMKIILSLVHEPHSNEMRVVLPRGQNYMEHLPKLLATVK